MEREQGSNGRDSWVGKGGHFIHASSKDRIVDGENMKVCPSLLVAKPVTRTNGVIESQSVSIKAEKGKIPLTGLKKVEGNYFFPKKGKTSLFFPSELTQEKIVDTIIDAVRSQEKAIHTVQGKTNKSYCFRGIKFDSGPIDMRVVIKRMDQSGLHIQTAYPTDDCGKNDEIVFPEHTSVTAHSRSLPLDDIKPRSFIPVKTHSRSLPVGEDDEEEDVLLMPSGRSLPTLKGEDDEEEEEISLKASSRSLPAAMDDEEEESETSVQQPPTHSQVKSSKRRDQHPPSRKKSKTKIERRKQSQDVRA